MGSVCRWSAAVAVVASLLAASPAGAQYFGRNKVQYKDFQFEVLKTAHFDVYFYPDEREAARQAAEMAERWYARFTQSSSTSSTAVSRSSSTRATRISSRPTRFPASWARARGA